MPRLLSMILLTTVTSSLLLGCGISAPSAYVQTFKGSSSAKQAKSSTIVYLDRMITETRDLSCVVAQGSKEFDNALAMNVPYGPIVDLRQQIQKQYDRPLTFFKLWNPAGEAHVTVVSPVEYQDMLKGMKPGSPIFTMDQIGAIAVAEGIQQADLSPLGIGSGQKQSEGRMDETFFVIVESRSLRQIRRKILESYLEHGGSPAAFNPDHFYPHITIGFTKGDIFEADGVIKDVAHSLDHRFELRLSNR